MEKETQTTKTLAAKLCAILGEFAPVEKGGKNTAQNYKYVKEADVSDSARKLLAKHGVFCLPSVEDITEREYQTKNGATMNLVRVKVRYTFINADNPAELMAVIHFGDGSDSGDKALYKALTGCHKYMLMRTFCIGSEDDPETNHEERGAISRPAQQPAKQPQNIVRGNFALRIPYSEKDTWKGVLRAAGYQWHAESKTWRGTQAIPELAQYQVESDLPEMTEDVGFPDMDPQTMDADDNTAALKARINNVQRSA